VSFAQKSVVIYRVWKLDAWGNPDDGWEVNDRRAVGVVSVRTDREHKGSDSWTVTNKKIVRALVDNDYLDEEALESGAIAIDGEDDGVLFVEDAETGQPLYQLEYDRRHSETEGSKGLFGEPSPQENPAEEDGFWTTQNILIAAGAVGVVGVLGYLVYKGMIAQPAAPQSPAQLPASPATPGGGGLTPQEQADAADQVPPFVPGVTDYS
jgi:hypothetical protein